METLFLLLSISGAIILLLIGLAAYLVKQWMENATKQWVESTETLVNAVNELKLAVAVITSNQGNADKTCNNNHRQIDTRLNAHSERLNQHGEAIIELQTITSVSRKNPRKNKSDES